MNIYYILLKFLISFLIIFLTSNVLFPFPFSKINIFNRIEKYLILCSKGILLNKNKYFNKVSNPKISIVSAIYNQEKVIMRFIRSIQNQIFNDIEIILVDDCSKDNSINIIENLQKEDERIILIKHNKNKGTLISRNDGILKSKGEYLIIPDPDDILSNDILEKAYNFVKENNYNFVRFNAYEGKKKIFMNRKVKDLFNISIYQPELSYFIFYGKSKFTQIDYVLWNKIIERETYIRAINSIKEYFLNQYMILYEDGLINYMLYKKANSFYFWDYIGYYYIINKNSIMNNYKNKIGTILNNDFKYLLFIFKYTNNKIYEKKIASLVFLNMPELLIDENYKYSYNDYKFYIKIINLYLNCKYITSSVKNKFKIIKNIIKKNI